MAANFSRAGMFQAAVPASASSASSAGLSRSLFGSVPPTTAAASSASSADLSRSLFGSAPPPSSAPTNRGGFFGTGPRTPQSSADGWQTAGKGKHPQPCPERRPLSVADAMKKAFETGDRSELKLALNALRQKEKNSVDMEAHRFAAMQNRSRFEGKLSIVAREAIGNYLKGVRWSANPRGPLADWNTILAIRDQAWRKIASRTAPARAVLIRDQVLAKTCSQLSSFVLRPNCAFTTDPNIRVPDYSPQTMLENIAAVPEIRTIWLSMEHSQKVAIVHRIIWRFYGMDKYFPGQNAEGIFARDFIGCFKFLSELLEVSKFDIRKGKDALAAYLEATVTPIEKDSRSMMLPKNTEVIDYFTTLLDSDFNRLLEMYLQRSPTDERQRNTALVLIVAKPDIFVEKFLRRLPQLVFGTDRQTGRFPYIELVVKTLISWVEDGPQQGDMYEYASAAFRRLQGKTKPKTSLLVRFVRLLFITARKLACNDDVKVADANAAIIGALCGSVSADEAGYTAEMFTRDFDSICKANRYTAAVAMLTTVAGRFGPTDSRRSAFIGDKPSRIPRNVNSRHLVFALTGEAPPPFKIDELVEADSTDFIDTSIILPADEDDVLQWIERTLGNKPSMQRLSTVVFRTCDRMAQSDPKLLVEKIVAVCGRSKIQAAFDKLTQQLAAEMHKFSAASSADAPAEDEDETVGLSDFSEIGLPIVAKHFEPLVAVLKSLTKGQ